MALFDWGQLAFALDEDPPQNAQELEQRLRELGLGTMHRVKLTRNRTVVVSHGRGELRIHHSFLTASEDVWRAVIAFVHARSKVKRSEARQKILAFPIQAPDVPVRRRAPEKTDPRDEPLVEELRKLHGLYNRDQFGGKLKDVSIRVSRRMKSRLGHYTKTDEFGPAEIAISRRHVKRDGWNEASHTLLHEMVHQWQDEQGLGLNHGSQFRAKARAIGITPAACRAVA
ncbi:MAG: SprT-like domain-containing protein [Gemmatimonadaceae bacterium]|nr:SprT-like domain-containing protein [Gemmatimonadaceae bacterium]